MASFEKSFTSNSEGFSCWWDAAERWPAGHFRGEGMRGIVVQDMVAQQCIDLVKGHSISNVTQNLTSHYSCQALLHHRYSKLWQPLKNRLCRE